MRGENEERRWLWGPGSSRTVTGAARREERAAAARVCVPDRLRQFPWSRAQEGEEGQLRARAFLPGPGAGFPVRPVQGGEQAGGDTRPTRRSGGLAAEGPAARQGAWMCPGRCVLRGLRRTRLGPRRRRKSPRIHRAGAGVGLGWSWGRKPDWRPEWGPAPCRGNEWASRRKTGIWFWTRGACQAQKGHLPSRRCACGSVAWDGGPGWKSKFGNHGSCRFL